MGFRRKRGRTYSKAVRRQGVMNQTEKWYKENVLDERLKSGELVKVEFERVKLILVHPDPGTKRRESSYLVDFNCVNSSGEFEMHEVKGYADEADRLKIKVAAELFPEWHWTMVHVDRRKGCVTKREDF